MADILQERVYPESELVCTVCVANFNGLEVIDDCLRSVLTQDCAFHVEIIVHDDASTDGSADYIAANYPQVTLIRSERNVGYCESNNRMARQARGQYLLLLNNDASLHPDALATLRATAEMQNGPVILTLPQYDTRTGQLVDRGLRLDPFLNPVPNLNPETIEISTVHGACLWISTDLWNEIGGFPTWFHMLAEDLFLCCAARVRGAKVMVTGHSGYRHRIGYSLGGGKLKSGHLVTTLRRRALSERNKNFVMTICYPTLLLAVLLPLHALLLLMEGSIMMLVARNPRIFTQVYVNSLSSLWRLRNPLIKYRHDVQVRRNTGWRQFFSTFTLLPHKLRLLCRHGFPRLAG